MTRKEQIKEYLRIIGNGETMGIPSDVGFECGVEWADAHPYWISVEDELPIDYEPVLAAFGNHFARVCFHCGEKWYFGKSVGIEEVDGITHWMPLPTPPMKGDQCND